MTHQSEAEIQAAVLVAVSTHGLFWRSNSALSRTPSGAVMRSNVRGCADITGVCRGRFVGIEIKTPHGRQSTVQRNFQAAVEREGGVYVIARSVEDALTALAAIP